MRDKIKIRILALTVCLVSTATTVGNTKVIANSKVQNENSTYNAIMINSADDVSLDTPKLRKQIQAEIAKYPQAGIAVAYKDLKTGKTFFLNEKKSFHAASTMKTPVMAEVFKQAAEGKFSLQDSIRVYNSFASIADGTSFSVKPSDDSEQDLYSRIGTRVGIMDLMLRMITKSSNLATNILIDKVGAKNVNLTMRNISAKDIQVLRGVEDEKAFEKGMNNTVTAYDLLLLFEQIAREQMVSKEASMAMVDILMQQQLKGAIIAKLPRDVRVANKTGSITAVLNDSGIVFLPDGNRYVLVLLSRGLEPEPAMSVLSQISLHIYQHNTTP